MPLTVLVSVSLLALVVTALPVLPELELYVLRSSFQDPQPP